MSKQEGKITWMPAEFLTFILLGPPAEEKCHDFFRLGSNRNVDGSSASGGISSTTSTSSSSNRGRGNARSSMHENNSNILDEEARTGQLIINLVRLCICLLNKQWSIPYQKLIVMLMLSFLLIL